MRQLGSTAVVGCALALATAGVAWPASRVKTVVGHGAVWPAPQSASGSGPAGRVMLNHPGDLALDPAGGLVFLDNGRSDYDSLVRRWSPATGRVATIAGGNSSADRHFCGDGSPAKKACLWMAHGISISRDGDLLVADTGNQVVRRIDAATGRIRTVAGAAEQRCLQADPCGSGGTARLALLNFPVSVTPSKRRGLLLTDAFTHRVRLIAPDGRVHELAGDGRPGFSGDGGPATAATLSYPADAKWLPQGGFVVSDAGNCRIRLVSPRGAIRTIAGSGERCGSSIPGIGSAAACPGELPGTTRIGGLSPRKVRLCATAYLAVDRSGGIYVVDQFRNRLLYLPRRGRRYPEVRHVAGAGDVPGFNGDRAPWRTRLAWPDSVAITRRGLVFSDTGNHRIRLLTGEPALPFRP